VSVGSEVRAFARTRSGSHGSPRHRKPHSHTLSRGLPMLHSRLDVCCVFALPSRGEALKITHARSRAAGTQERLHVLQARLDVCSISILAPLRAVLTTTASNPIHLFLSRGHPGAVVSFVAALGLRF